MNDMSYLSDASLPSDLPQAIEWIIGLRNRVDNLLDCLNTKGAEALTDEQIDSVMLTYFPKTRPTSTWRAYARAVHSMAAKTQAATNQQPASGAAYAGYSTMPPHQQRVVDELAELNGKLAKLETFTGADNFAGSPLFSKLPAAEQHRLRVQRHAMKAYADILADRIDAFDLPA